MFMLMYRPVLLFLLCVLGGFLGLEKSGIFYPGQEINPQHWTLGTHEEVVDPNSGRQTQIRNGSLHIGYYAFGRADELTWNGEPLSDLTISLQNNSHPVQVHLSGRRQYVVDIGTKQWKQSHEVQWRDYQGPWQASLLTQDPLSLKITTQYSDTNLSIISANGITLDYSHSGPTAPVWGSVLGLLLGVALVYGSSSVITRLLILLPLLVPLYPHWTYLLEGLRLTQSQDWELARIVLGFSFVPAIGAILLLIIGERLLPKAPLVWWSIFGLTLVLAPFGWLETPLGALILGSHLLLQRRSSLKEESWLWDAPVLLLPIFCGWGLGLLLVICFRWLLLGKHLSFLLENARKPASDQAFLLLFLIPITLEWSLRDSYLGEVWSASSLEGPHTAEEVYNPTAYWSDSCGDKETAHSILYVGGSSTGSSYQFATDPEAFFSAQLHQRLCATRALHSYNYGNADRDTHTISRTLEQMLDDTNAQLIVLYVGHNDLGANNPYSRKEREKMEASPLRKIGRWARQLRLISGLDLLFRLLRQPQTRGEILDKPQISPNGKPIPMTERDPGASIEQPFTASVPLPDARENLLYIANIAEQRGAKCLMVAQHIARNAKDSLEEYWAMEKELAATHRNLWFLDPRPTLRSLSESKTLLDNNHLSKEGHKILAGELQQKVVELLP